MDLNRKSMHDVVMENLERHGRKTYIHRLTYIFVFEENGYQEIKRKFTKLIQNQNNNYHDERLTGILFIYRDTVGIHIIESSDSMLLKHLRLVYTSPDLFSGAKNVVKLVSISTFIDKRFFLTWLNIEVISTYPSETMEIVPESKEDIYYWYKSFMRCLNNAKDFLFNSTFEPEQLTDGGSIFYLMSQILPPAQLIHRLIQTPLLQDLKIFRDRTSSLMEIIPYHELVWPIPMEYVPHHTEVITTQKPAPLDEENKT